MFGSFPQIFALGSKPVIDIFNGVVEITEKFDGSQFSCGKINGEMRYRSKNKEIFVDAVPQMFNSAVSYIEGNKDRILEGFVYYFEYLSKPKHNVLSYSRTPKHNLALFGVINKDGKFISSWNELNDIAEMLGVEVVPLLLCGNVNDVTQIYSLLEKDSILGNTKIEGIVIKNYSLDVMVGGRYLSLVSAKYVSEKFKEKMNRTWKAENTSKGRFELFKSNFRTMARWQKAVQHLRENNELENIPRDIGKLIKEIKDDITKEEKDFIQEYLWREFSPEILREAIRGFPEWYKAELIKNCNIEKK